MKYTEIIKHLDFKFNETDFLAHDFSYQKSLVDIQQKSINISYENAKKYIRESLIYYIDESTNKSDILAFSGGLDSTIIALVCKYILNKNIWLTITDTNREDINFSLRIIHEHAFTNIIDVHTPINKEDFNEFMQVMKYPTADFGLYVLYTIWKLTKSAYITGIGSEFIFGGTLHHLSLANIFKVNDSREFKKYEISDNYNQAKLNSIQHKKYYDQYLKYMNINSIDDMLNVEFCNKLFFTETLLFTSLYHKYNIEFQYPFLNCDLVEFVNALPLQYKMNRYGFKYILIDAFSDIIPEYILNRPKQGLYYDKHKKHEIYSKLFLNDIPVKKIYTTSINYDRNMLYLNSWKNAENN